MSTYDKASLVLIPSGTKEGVIFSQKPTNGDGDFTFSRSTAATRVNADGLIEKETQNLLLQSNSFDTSWSNLNLTLTGSQAGYDGSNDAWKLTAVGTGGGRKVQQANTSSGVLSFSVYAKAGTANYIALECAGTGGFYEYFNLTDGTDGAGVGNIDVNAEDVGNGWWRFTIVGNPSGLSSVNIFASNTNNSTDISDGQYIYIQDAQLEQGLVARDYIETTTAAVEGGITDNVPRLDYTDSSCPALLLEPQRTNILYHSEYFGAWSAFGGAVLTHNDAISPEGISNAVKISTNGVFKQDPTAANTDYVFSVFAKTNTATSVTINYIDQSAPFRGGTIIYTFATDAVAVTGQSENNSVTAEREDYGNGWIRVIMNFKTNVAKNYNYQEIRFLGGDGWIYGAQLEQSSYPTSYIPTYGASVTRVEDECSVTGVSDLIGQTEGTIFIEIDENNTEDTRFFAITNGLTGNNTNYFIIQREGSNALQVRYFNDGGSEQTLTTISGFPMGNHKIAFGYKNGEFNICVDGTSNLVSSTITMPVDFNTIVFSNHPRFGSVYYNTIVKQALIFPTRLTDSELQALTTI